MTMNMLKKSVLALALAAGVGGARADYQIWWQVDQAATATEPVAFASAKVAYRTSSTGAYSAYLQTDSAVLAGDLWAPAAEGGTTTELWWGVLPTEAGVAENAYDGYQFRVELFDEGDGLIAVGTEVKSLADLKGLHAVYTGTSPTIDGKWVATTFQTVPEPTSALLLLVGVAGLALKRRNA